MKYFANASRVMLIMACIVVPATGMSQVRLTDAEKQEVALQAMGFLKASEITETWNAGFREARASDVVAFLRLAAPTAAVAPRLRALVDSLKTFSLAPSSWVCGPEVVVESRRAVCALEHTRFFADVGEPGMRGDTAYVVISLFADEDGKRTTVKTLVQVARVGDRWRAVKAFVFRE